MSYFHFFQIVAPEALITLTALLVIGIDVAWPRARALCPWAAALGLCAAGAAVTMLPSAETLFNGMLVIGPLTSLFKIICIVLALLTVGLAAGTRIESHRGEYLALLLMATVGLMLLVESEELLMIFIGLELTGLSLYILTAFDKTDRRSAEAGLKYFLFGSTASAFTLFGLSLIYGMCGTTGLREIAQQVASHPVERLLAVGLIMTLIGLAFKVAAAPFHLWAPDTYQGAPIPSAAFIASGSKVASFVLVGKFLLIGFEPFRGNAEWRLSPAHLEPFEPYVSSAQFAPGWAPLLAGVAALSIVIGSVVALSQTNVRRILAYSAVAHAGYTLIGLVAGGPTGFAATLFYTTLYAVTLLGAFGVVALVREETGGDDLSDFAGLRSRSPLLAICMTIFMLSLAGLPPLAGFFGKFYLFTAALHSGHGYGLLWLVVVALAGSLVSLYYYLAIIKAVLVTEPESETVSAKLNCNCLQRLSLTLLAGTVALLGILPDALLAKIIRVLP